MKKRFAFYWVSGMGFFLTFSTLAFADQPVPELQRQADWFNNKVLCAQNEISTATSDPVPFYSHPVDSELQIGCHGPVSGDTTGSCRIGDIDARDAAHRQAALHALNLAVGVCQTECNDNGGLPGSAGAKTEDIQYESDSNQPCQYSQKVGGYDWNFETTEACQLSVVSQQAYQVYTEFMDLIRMLIQNEKGSLCPANYELYSSGIDFSHPHECDPTEKQEIFTYNYTCCPLNYEVTVKETVTLKFDCYREVPDVLNLNNVNVADTGDSAIGEDSSSSDASSLNGL